ncbi:NnrS family protein [Burkholderiaceae bacterium DAT-1]|nr:NnrS family protein [Burkholderiaceae bacterium DAT-1]
MKAESGFAKRLWQVPHRMGFLFGVISLVMLAGWWAIVLMTAATPVVPAVLAHGVLMPIGCFPLFMLGFLFTAGPRWLAINHTPPHGPIMTGFLVGLMVALGGLHAERSVILAGFLVMILAWAGATLAWIRCILLSSLQDRAHAWRLAVAMSVGFISMTAAAMWARSGDTTIWLLTRNLSMWGFLLPVFLIVSHRMIPFFTQSALASSSVLWRPMRLLDAWLLACLGRILTSSLQLNGLTAIIDGALAISFAFTSWRWGIVASLKVRLLAMLHLSFAWLAPACGLQLLVDLGCAPASAPIHALATGLFVTMLVGFVTRVTYGHGGRSLQVDGVTWWIYCGLHLLAALRVGLALMTSAGSALHMVVVAWVILLLFWAARMVPIYLHPRLDGKPG